MSLLRSDIHAQMKTLTVCIPHPFSLADLVATDPTLASNGIVNIYVSLFMYPPALAFMVSFRLYRLPMILATCAGLLLGV